MSVAALGPIVQRGGGRATRSRRGSSSGRPRSWSLAARSVAARLEMRGDAFTFYLAGGVFQRRAVAGRGAAAAAGRGRAALPGPGRSTRSRRSAPSGSRSPRPGAARGAALQGDRHDERMASAMRVSDLRQPGRAGARARRATSRARSPRNPALVLGLADRPHADSAVSRAGAAARAPAAPISAARRRSTSTSSSASARPIRAAIARSCSGTCSTTSTCRRAGFTF